MTQIRVWSELLQEKATEEAKVRGEIPQIWRQVGDPKLVIKTPWVKYGVSARQWLNKALPPRAHHVEYAGNGRWTISRRHLDAIIEACLQEYGAVKLIWDSNENEKCTVACQNANPDTRDDCECVCGGDFHGGQDGNRWKNVVGELLVASQVRRRETVITR